jgi:hypothetical protein
LLKKISVLLLKQSFENHLALFGRAYMAHPHAAVMRRKIPLASLDCCFHRQTPFSREIKVGYVLCRRSETKAGFVPSANRRDVVGKASRLLGPADVAPCFQECVNFTPLPLSAALASSLARAAERKQAPRKEAAATMSPSAAAAKVGGGVKKIECISLAARTQFSQGRRFGRMLLAF